MRIIIFIAAFALWAGCSPDRKSTSPDASGASHAPAPLPGPPLPVTEVVLDLEGGQSAGLTGGIRVHALAGSAPRGKTARIRIEPEDALVGLPHTGASARTGPVLAVTLAAGQDVPLFIEIPIDPVTLPQGLSVENAYAAHASQGGWNELDSILVPGAAGAAILVVAVPKSGRTGVLVGPDHATPVVGGHAVSILAAAPAVFGPHDFAVDPTGQKQPPGEIPDPLWVLETVAGTMSLDGTSYQLMETKERNRDGSARLLAVRQRGGLFETDPVIIARVYMANEIRKRLIASDLPLVAQLLREDANHLLAMTAAGTDTGHLERLLLASAGAGIALPATGADQESSLLSLQRILEDEELRKGVEKDLLALEATRTRIHLAWLAARISTLEPSTDDGDGLVEIHGRLAWALGRIDELHALLAAGCSGDDQMVTPWHDAGEIRAALALASPRKEKSKTTDDAESPDGQDVGLADLKALAEALSFVDPHAGTVVNVLWAAPDLIGAMSSLTGAAQRGEWIDTKTVLAAAAEAGSRPAAMAPPPETAIAKSSFINSKLSVTATGTDQDGQVTGYRWWFDDGKDPHMIKGKGHIVASLSGLKSGAHDIFVAAVDDDGQKDSSAARLSFYVRRSVEVATKSLDISFDAHSFNVNSEHTRSIKLFVRRLEGPVGECADEHYRFGIDGGGNVTVGFGFSADKTANVAHSTSIVKDTFKNKEMASCIRKAIKNPRMRYNQDYKPAATITVTFHLKPTILYFDAKGLGDAPGPDVLGAALYKKCTAKALKKVEAWCDQAVRSLPGPWDAQKQLIEAGLAQAGPEGSSDGAGVMNEPGTDEQAIENGEETDADQKVDPGEEETLAPVDIESLIIPPPEFDSIEVHAGCVADNVSIFIENCMLKLTKKRLWCVDSCLQKAGKCTKQCTKAEDWAEDPFTCQEACWTDDAFPCAENCALKDTPFAAEISQASVQDEW